ncbi:uncharacterized protein PAN0_014d4907 [Moesziomyces antarcticus]|uniref:Uncharacterized protein n=1 Tax=Pseudozyma antarctica TaxID=84753 RepID=A0A081CJ38_PSEA2|nr:uncharacterized protein PAN0_014d4907 [Moesziomyces antarcticus]GAK66684.1 hypothetical protein PAN0_014d4907 [Moesziomyces antarcticus]
MGALAGLSMVSALLLLVLVGMVSTAAVPPRSGSDAVSPPAKRHIIADPFEEPLSPGQPPGSDDPPRGWRPPILDTKGPISNPEGPSDAGPGHKNPPPADVSQDFRLFISAQF